METLPHEKQIDELKKTIARLKEQNQHNPLFASEIERLEEKLKQLKEEIYSQLSPWQRIQICRHPGRPHTFDYIKNMCDNFQELSGDRAFRDDRSVIGGFATIGKEKFMLIGQEKGSDTPSRIEHNFGMMHPEGYRKALRLMKLAEKFSLPVVSLIDTPGAFPGLESEERGVGWAIAENMKDMSRIQTPIIVIIIGEGCSGGAIGIGVGDSVAMLQHAYYSVISPEGCASILWKDPSKKVEASSTLKIHAENLLEFNVIDEIIIEPLGGAHHDTKAACQSVKGYILKEWDRLKKIRPDVLIEERYQKFRKLGKFYSQTDQKIAYLNETAL